MSPLTPQCPLCGWNHISSDVRRLHRFDQTRPPEYASVWTPGVVYESREAAELGGCVARREQR